MNPSAQIVAAAWPSLWAAGLLSVARPATSYEWRDYDLKARQRDLARRAARYQARKLAKAAEKDSQ